LQLSLAHIQHSTATRVSLFTYLFVTRLTYYVIETSLGVILFTERNNNAMKACSS